MSNENTKTTDTAAADAAAAAALAAEQARKDEQQKSRFWKFGRTAAYVTGGVVVVGAVGAAIWAFSRSGKAAEVVEAAVEAAA